MRDWILDRWRGRWLELVASVVNIAGIVIAVGWFLALFLAHVKMITQLGPQEYNEPAVYHMTWLIEHGRNPFELKELPAALNCFGPLYNYVVLAFKPLLGTDYVAHRMVNLIFLVASLALLVRVMLRAGTGLGIALLSVVFYYWMGLDNIMITARPDLVGLFFFLLGLLVPWERNYTRGSTIFGLVCALIAIHCKLYFGLAGCATLMGYFMVRSKREACWMGVGFFGLLGLSMGICCLVYPYFYLETFTILRRIAVLNSHEDISITHTLMLFQNGWPFMLLMLYGVGVQLWRRESARRHGRPAGTAEGLRLQVLGASFLIFLMIVYFYMGWNAGAWFTYHLHLLFPLMFVLTAYSLTRPWVKIGFGVLLAVFVLCSLKIPPVPESNSPYRKMEQLIYACRGEVLGIPAVTDIFLRQGRRVLHNGNTMYVGFAFADEGIARYPKVAALSNNYNAIGDEVVHKIKTREYLMVLTEFDEPYFCTSELLKQNYDKVDQIDYFTYFGHSPVRVWRPKPREEGGSNSP